MKNVIYDRVTKQIKDYDRDPMPFELSLAIPYPIQLSRTVQEFTGVMVQKINEEGQLLYVHGETETTEASTITTWDTISNTYLVATDQTTPGTDEEGNPIEIPVYETVTTTSEVPVAWEDHEPIMIEEVVSRTYTLDQNCAIFTADEVTEVIANTPTPVSEIEILRQHSAEANQTQSDFMDYIFSVFPEIS